MNSPQRTQSSQRLVERQRGRSAKPNAALHQHFTSSLCVLCVLCGDSIFFPTRTNAAPAIVAVEGAAFAGELVAASTESGFSFRVDVPVATATSPEHGEIRRLPADEFVRWGHPALPRKHTWILLADGSLLVTAADWSGGAVVQTDGQDLVVLSDVFEEVRISRDKVRGLVFAPREHPEVRERLAEFVWGSTGERDEVLLTNEDRLAGQLVKLDRGSLTLSTERGEAKLPLSRVEAVIFGGNRPLSVVRSQSKYAVGLRDGSLLHAVAVQGDEDELSVELADGIRLEGGTFDGVVFLQSLGGERFVYLSDLEPVDYRHVPYLNIEWPYQRDRNVLGGPLSVQGNRYLKGIGMHSAARLTYRLDGKYRRFEAAAAIDDSAGRRGSVTFGVYVLRDAKWQEAYKSAIVRGVDPPFPVSVDVRGAQGLTLMVDYADRGDELDHADWLDARLNKN